MKQLIIDLSAALVSVAGIIAFIELCKLLTIFY